MRRSRVGRLEGGLMSAVRQKCAVAETGPPVAAQVLFEVLRPFGPDVDAASQAAFHAVSQLLQDEFPHNTADVKNSVYRGRCPYTGSRPGDDVRFDPYLVACLWLGGQVVAAAALRLNLPPLSAVSSSSSGGGGGGGGGAEAAHLQVVLQATSARLQRRGLGRLLTRCVMRAAAEEGHQYLTALVSDQTKAPFWERVGFCAPPSSYLRLPLALYRSLEESRAHSLFSDVSVWHVELPGWESQGAVRGEAAAEAAGAEAGMETAAVAMETEGPGGVAVGAEPGTPSPAGRRRCAAAHAMVEEAAARVAAAALGSAASSPAAAAAATHAPLAAGASGGGGGWPGSPQQARLLPHPQQDSGAAAPQHMAPPQLVLPPPSQEPPQLLTPEQRLVYPESRRPSAGAGQSSAAGAAHSSLLGLSGGWPTPQNLSPDGTAGFEEKAAGPMPSQQQVKEWQRWGLLQRREQRNLAQQALEDGSDCGLANCITEAWQSQQAAGAGAGAAGQHTRTMLPASPARAQSSAAAAAVVAAATAAAAGAHGAQQQESLAPYTQVQQGSLGGAGQQGQELESAAAAAAGGMTWTTGLALQQQQQQQQLDAGRAARVQQAQACGASTAAAASSWLAAVAPGGPPAINFTFPAQLIQQPWLLEWPATGPAGAAAGAAAFAGGLGRNRCGDSSGTGGDGGGGSASLRAPQLEAAEAAVPAGLAGHMPAAPGAQQQLQSPQPQPLQQQAAPSSEAAAGQQLQQGSVSFQLFSRCCRTGACTLSRAAAHAAFPKQAAAATQAHLARQLSYLGGPSAPAAAGAGAATAAIATAAAGACAGIVGSSSAVSQPVGIWYRRPAASPAAGVGDDAAALLPHHGARLSGDGQQRYRLCGMGPLRTALGVDNSTPLRLTVLTECGRSVIAPDAAAAGVAVLVLSHAFAAFVHGHFGVRGSLMTALLGPEVATRGGVPDLVLYDKTTRAPIPGGPGGARLRTLCSGDNRLPGRTPVWDVAGLGPWLRRHQAAEGDQLVFTAEPSAAATLEDPSPSAAATEGGGRSDDVTTTTRVYVKYVRVPRPSAGQGAAGGGGRGAGAAAGPAGGCSSAGHPIAMDAMQEGCPAADTIESDGWEADGQDAQSEQPDDETAGVTATMANGALVRAPGLMGEHLQQWAAGDGAAAGVGEGESRRALTAAPAAGGATASEDATTRCYGPPAELQHGDGTCLVVCRARFSQLSFEAVAALLGPATATSGMMPGGAAAGGDGGPTELPVRVPPHQQHWAPAAALRCLPAPSGHQKARRWRVVGLGVWLEKVGAVPGSSMLHFRAVRGATGTTAYGPAGNAAGATTADAAAGPGASGRCGHVVAVEVSVVAVQGGGPSRLPCGTGGGSIGVPGSGSAATAATTKGGCARHTAAVPLGQGSGCLVSIKANFNWLPYGAASALFGEEADDWPHDMPLRVPPHQRQWAPSAMLSRKVKRPRERVARWCFVGLHQWLHKVGAGVGSTLRFRVVREAAAAAAAGAGSGTTSGRLVAVEVSVVGKAASAKRAHLSADEGETTDEVVVSTESTESTEGSSETDELDSDQDEQQPLQARNAQPGDPCQYSGPTPHGTGTRRGRLAVGDDPCVVTYKHHWMPSWTMAALLGPAAAKAPAAGVAVPAVLPLRVPLPERHLAPAAVLKRGNGKDAASWCFTGLCAWLRHVHVSRGGVLRFGAVWEAPAAGREQGGSAGAGGSGSATAGGGRRVVAVEVSVVEAVVGTQQDGGAAAGSGLEPAGTRSWAESVKDHSAGGGHAAPLGRTAAVAVLAVAPASGHRRPGPQTAAPAGTGAGGAAAGHTLLPLLRQPQQQQHSLGAVSPVAETAAALVGAVDSTAAGMECRRAGTDNGAPGPAADGGEAAPTRAAASSLSSGRGGGWRPVYLIPSDLKSAGGSPQNFAGGSKHLAGHEETPAAGHSPNAAAVAGRAGSATGADAPAAVRTTPVCAGRAQAGAVGERVGAAGPAAAVGPPTHTADDSHPLQPAASGQQAQQQAHAPPPQAAPVQPTPQPPPMPQPLQPPQPPQPPPQHGPTLLAASDAAPQAAPAAPPAHQGPCGSDSDAAAAAGGSAGATPAAAGPAPRPPSGGAAVPAATAGLREALSQHFPRALSLLLTEVDAAAQQEQGEQRRGLGVAAAAALPVLPMEVLKRYAVGVGWEYEVEIERRRVDCAAEAGPGHDGSTRYLATVCMLQPGDGDATITASGKDAADKDTARQLAAAACLQRLLTLGVSPQVLWPGCRSSQPPAAQTPRPQPQPQQENYGLAQAAHVAAPQPSPAPAPQPPQQAAQPAGQQQQQQQQQQAQVSQEQQLMQQQKEEQRLASSSGAGGSSGTDPASAWRQPPQQCADSTNQCTPPPAAAAAQQQPPLPSQPHSPHQAPPPPRPWPSAEPPTAAPAVSAPAPAATAAPGAAPLAPPQVPQPVHPHSQLYGTHPPHAQYDPRFAQQPPYYPPAPFWQYPPPYQPHPGVLQYPPPYGVPFQPHCSAPYQGSAYPAHHQHSTLPPPWQPAPQQSPPAPAPQQPPPATQGQPAGPWQAGDVQQQPHQRAQQQAQQ